MKEDDGSGRGPKVAASIRLARQVRSAGFCCFLASRVSAMLRHKQMYIV